MSPVVLMSVQANEGSNFGANPIDRFVVDGQRDHGIVRVGLANRQTLIRRLTLDLTGLPPTPDAVNSFLTAQHPDAYERLVDRLLASPQFGERMAQSWLDLARYADSNGYHDDSNRSMWPYRDWVIDAFNASKPFDEFTIEQLAGDLLPEPSLDQLVATAFHRNAPTTSEDGANPDEYRIRYAVDRVNTTAQVWLGLTMQCAECHDHKYDPITTREYYQLLAFFDQTPEQPLFRGQHAPPSISVPNDRQRVQLADWDREWAALGSRLREVASRRQTQRETWLSQLPQVEHANDGNTICEFKFDTDDPWKNTGVRGRHVKPRAGSANALPKVRAGLGSPALHLSGDGDAIDCAQLFEFRRTLGFTCELWVRFESDGVLFSKVDVDQGQRGVDVRLSDGRVVVRLVDQWPDRAIQVSTVARFDQRSWMHMSITYDGSGTSGGIHIFVNGQAQDLNVDLSGEINSIRNVSSLWIGGDGERIASIRGFIDDVRFYKWPLSTQSLQLAPYVRVSKLDQSKSAHQEFLASFFRDFVDSPTVKIRQQMAEVTRQRDLLRQRLPRLRIMRDRTERRPTHVLTRGDFRQLGEQVRPDTPSMLPALTRHQSGTLPNRLDLANWLTTECDIHTARVMTNRLWAQLFGLGIVSTLDDFGVQGEPPSHPELLDWLARELVDQDWDLKKVIRTIVMSETYRRSHKATADQRQQDPKNRWLGRVNRRRLSAESIRDQALFLAGLMSDRIGGPSVRPYQPPGLWRDMAKGDELTNSYDQDHGESLYRRGLYTFWKRSIHYPAFSVFDAPNRQVCTSSRPVTNTASQALALMNDTTFVEAARRFAERVMFVSSDEIERIDWAMQVTLSRRPTADERRVLRRSLSKFIQHYRDHEEAAYDFVQVGETRVSSKLETWELAAWTALAQMILSLDETITRP